jgi:hypothetical protein
MNDEEKKPEVVEEKPAEETKADKPAAEDSDFADEVKPLSEAPAPATPKAEGETAPAEVKPVEPTIELHKVEESSETPIAETPAAGAPKKGTKPSETIYEYDDQNLETIEGERQNFYKLYKKINIWKTVLAVAVIAVVLVGFILPYVLKLDTTTQSIITLSSLGAAVVAYGVFALVTRKKLEGEMKTYFAHFYEHQNAFVFSNPEVKSLTGSVDDKLPAEEFNAPNIYKDVAQVGSRANLHFIYKGLACGIADAAGQTRTKKALQTVFVGKYVQFPNNYDGPKAIVYLKGNKRALPPTNLGAYELIEDHRDMVIYGENGGKKALTKKVKDAIAQFQTNETLCDMAIVIATGKTSVYMGYEDTLMVMPLEKPFNPAPTVQFKNDFSKILMLVDALNFKGAE